MKDVVLQDTKNVSNVETLHILQRTVPVPMHYATNVVILHTLRNNAIHLRERTPHHVLNLTRIGERVIIQIACRGGNHLPGHQE